MQLFAVQLTDDLKGVKVYINADLSVVVNSKTASHNWLFTIATKVGVKRFIYLVANYRLICRLWVECEWQTCGRVPCGRSLCNGVLRLAVSRKWTCPSGWGLCDGLWCTLIGCQWQVGGACRGLHCDWSAGEFESCATAGIVDATTFLHRRRDGRTKKLPEGSAAEAALSTMD